MIICNCSIGTSGLSGKHGKDCPCEYFNLLAKVKAQAEQIACLEPELEIQRELVRRYSAEIDQQAEQTTILQAKLALGHSAICGCDRCKEIGDTLLPDDKKLIAKLVLQNGRIAEEKFNLQVENKRLKECAEMGLEANAEKAKQIENLKSTLGRLISYDGCDSVLANNIHLKDEIEQALAAQP